MGFFFVISLRIAESGVGSVPFKIIADFSPHCLGVSTHLTAKTSVFIEVLTLAHDRVHLINSRWLLVTFLNPMEAKVYVDFQHTASASWLSF